MGGMRRPGIETAFIMKPTIFQAAGSSPGGKKGSAGNGGGGRDGGEGDGEGGGGGTTGSKPHLRVMIPGQKGFVPRTVSSYQTSVRVEHWIPRCFV